MRKAIATSLCFGLIILANSGCQQKSDPETYEEKKEALTDYRKDMVDLRQRINSLEAEIKEIEDQKGIRESRKAVRLSSVEFEQFKHSIDVQGLVESDENVVISSEVNGIATNLLVDIGDQVQKGEVIAKIDDRTLRDQLEELKTAYELADDTYNKRKNLWDKQIGSQLEYLQAKNRKESLENQIQTLRSNMAKYTIRTPIAGKVDEVRINRGEMVSPGLPIATVVNVSQVKVVADVSEKYVSSIKEGDSVTVFFPAIGLTRHAVIDATSQVISKENRTFKLVVKLDNYLSQLKPNLLAKINIYDYVKEEALVIPTRLIHYQQDSTYVFRAQINSGDTIAQKVKVNLAYSNAQRSLVDNGLSQGDLLIVEGHDRVSHGDKIKPVR